MDNQTDENLQSFSGMISCFSDQSVRTGDKIKDTMYLTNAEVKAKAMETYSELDVRRFMEEIPRFYNYKSTIFTNLGKLKDCLIIVGQDSWAQPFYWCVWH